MGCVYRRGKTYWIKYYDHGKPVLESAKTAKETEAKRLLKLREGQVEEHKFPGLQVNRTRFDDLAEELLIDYRVNGKKSLHTAMLYIDKHLRPFFGGQCKATAITTMRIKEFIASKQTEGLSNASINRCLSALKRMFNLAMRQSPPLVASAPFIPMLREDNVRSGFFFHEEYLAVLGCLPGYLKGPFTLGYFAGLRREEILSLEWSQVNMFDKTIRLNPGRTKNNEGRVLPLTGPLLEMIRERDRGRNGELVFHNEGIKIGDFRKAWRKAFKDAGIPEKLFHDLRRTAVRNMIRAGIPERIAMKISGHKTRSIFDRYCIVNENDLRFAGERMSALYEESQTLVESGYNLVTIGRGRKADAL